MITPTTTIVPVTNTIATIKPSLPFFNLSINKYIPNTLNAKTSPNGEITVINGKPVSSILYEQEFQPQQLIASIQPYLMSTTVENLKSLKNFDTISSTTMRSLIQSIQQSSPLSSLSSPSSSPSLKIQNESNRTSEEKMISERTNIEIKISPKISNASNGKKSGKNKTKLNQQNALQFGAKILNLSNSSDKFGFRSAGNTSSSSSSSSLSSSPSSSSSTTMPTLTTAIPPTYFTTVPFATETKSSIVQI
ncbi:hypothetical protein QR98_0073240, partial [Sarcoptes scabiei]